MLLFATQSVYILSSADDHLYENGWIAIIDQQSALLKGTDDESFSSSHHTRIISNFIPRIPLLVQIEASDLATHIESASTFLFFG